MSVITDAPASERLFTASAVMATLPDTIPAVSFIGVITFVFSAIGVVIGNIFGAKFKSKAEFAGGVVLILMGLKILLEHLGIIG